MDKKGYIRTLEAVIAIVTILTFTYSVMPKAEADTGKTPYLVKSAQDYITSEIAENSNYRGLITGYSLSTDVVIGNQAPNLPQIDDLIKKHTPPGYNYTALLCKQTGCLTDVPSKNVYVTDIMITGAPTPGIDNEPRIVRIWMWAAG